MSRLLISGSSDLDLFPELVIGVGRSVIVKSAFMLVRGHFHELPAEGVVKSRTKNADEVLLELCQLVIACGRSLEAH